MNLKSKLEEKAISENCSLNTYITYDETNYVLEINYLDGKFISEKQFANNYIGIAKMEEAKDLYRNEEDVKRYFGLI